MIDVQKTIYIGCDGRYFNLYAEIFIASLDINSPGQNVFFSICNPLDDFDAQLSYLKQQALATHIESEVYHKDLSGHSDEEKRGFYVNHRFVRLNDFFKSREGNVLFIDIDSMIRNDLIFYNELFAHSDVAIQLRLEEKRKRVRVLGAGIFLRHNERTLGFMQKLADALRDKYTWYTDQLMIYELLKNDDDLKVSDFEKQYLDWEFEDTALVWCGKGDRKFLDEKYMAYAAELLAQFRQTQRDQVILFPAVTDRPTLASFLAAKKLKNELSSCKSQMVLLEHYPSVSQGALVHAPATQAQIANAIPYAAASEISEQMQHADAYRPSHVQPIVNLRKPYRLIKAMNKLRHFFRGSLSK